MDIQVISPENSAFIQHLTRRTGKSFTATCSEPQLIAVEIS